MMTRHNRLLRSLTARGYREDRAAHTTKYLSLRHPHPAATIEDLRDRPADDRPITTGEHRLLLGKIALRFTRSTVANSAPVSPRMIVKLLEES